MSQALSIIQGIVLKHAPSKHFLGRRHALEIFLDLLLVSRHLPPNSDVDVTEAQTPLLSSVIIDTLLCILVDSSPALRAFEESSGVQVIVKLLKRGGTPKEARCVSTSTWRRQL